MVKGYKRNVVLLKSTNSDIFDMAYFIMKDDVKERGIDVIDEANRILEENSLPRRRAGVRWIVPLLSFLCGTAVSSLIMLALLL